MCLVQKVMVVVSKEHIQEVVFEVLLSGFSGFWLVVFGGQIEGGTCLSCRHCLCGSTDSPNMPDPPKTKMNDLSSKPFFAGATQYTKLELSAIQLVEGREYLMCISSMLS